MENEVQRREIVAEIERLDKAFEAALPPLLKAEEAAKAKAEKANDALQAARKASAEAQLAHANLASPHAHRKMQLEAELQRTASPLIDEAVKVLRALYNSVGNTPIADALLHPDRQGDGTPRPEDTQALRDAVDRRDAHMARIKEAILEAQALTLEALSDEELAQKLEELRRQVAEPHQDAAGASAVAGCNSTPSS